VRLRREHFGGIVFDTRTGLTLDVDRAAFTWLWAAQQGGVSPIGADEAENRLFARMLGLGVVSVAPRRDESPPASLPDTLPIPWPSGPHLTAPETVHWAITYDCTSRCPDCYARRCREGAGPPLDTGGAMLLVERLAEWGVLQLAIGGGEPLLRPDLPEIAACARERGLVVHVTTGYHHLTYPELARLARSVTALQIGIKIERLLEDAEAEIELLAETVEQARDAGLHVGANLMLSRTGVEHFEMLLAAFGRAGFPRVTLLRYKPPADVARWRQEVLLPYEILEFERCLPELLATVPEMTVRLDCALSFLQRHVSPSDALAAGVRGCVAADRLLALGPDGGMYPCSQLVHPRFRAGDILADDPAVVWAASRLLKHFRHFREKRAFRLSACGVCRATAHCSGCRVFAHDVYGAEPVCPDPIMPPLTALGKAGRRLDLARFIEGRGWVGVSEYMQRYGVGRKTALRELSASPNVLPPPDLPKKQTPDYFLEAQEALIRQTQAGIGCTNAGFPYVTREEVLAWMDDWNAHDYPEWLRSTRESVILISDEEGDNDEDYQYP
jgi:radical SAM protein with 4Fe4S-binding SPASM domain